MFGIDDNLLILILIQLVLSIAIILGIIFFFRHLFHIKIGKIEFIKNPQVQKKDYENINEFIYDKKTNIVPKKKNRLLCIFFSEDKGCYFIIRKFSEKLDYFTFKHGMYLIDNESIHITGNGTRISFYLEGISTPLKMSNIEKITKEVTYIDLFGKKQKSMIQKIKGLKFDAKILYTFADRKFAELFTKQSVDSFQMIIIVLAIITFVFVIINMGVSYFFR